MVTLEQGGSDRVSPRREVLLRAGLVAIPLLGLAHIVLGLAAPPGLHVVAPGDAFAPSPSIGWAVRILLTLCVTTAVVLGPGLWLRQRARGSVLLGPAFVWVPGTLVLSASGLVAWLLAYRVDPDVTATVLLTPILAVLVASAVRVPVRSVFRHGEAAVCGLLLIVVLVGVAKATWSQGPDGDLYAGTVSRTLESGDRSDSRIPFHVVQLVTHGLDPEGEIAVDYFAPYSFSDRAPLAGLAAAPVVLSSGSEPPLAFPNQVWEPFDPTGFAAYRISLEVLGATVLLAVFGLLSVLVPRRVAWAGTLLVALTPFIVHEVYFTWPKLLAASFGVAALTALLSRRPAAAGLLLGLAYLAQPVGLFVALAVGGIWVGLAWQTRPRVGASPERSRDRALRRWLVDLVRTGALLALGLGACWLAWRVINAGNYTQSGRFGNYLYEANTARPVELSQWIASRLRSVGNTLVPLELFVFDNGAGPLNAWPPGSEKPLIVPFSFQYWNTLPFGVGIVYFPVFVVGLWRYARRNAAVALTGLVAPFLIFAIYWGSYSTGLMREGLQGWIVFALLAAFLGHTVYDRGSRTRWADVVRVLVTARGVEVLFMLVVSTVWTNGWLGENPYVPTDLVAVAVMFGGVAAMMFMTWRAFDPARLSEGGSAALQAGTFRST